jgi:hypothetical protein
VEGNVRVGQTKDAANAMSFCAGAGSSKQSRAVQDRNQRREGHFLIRGVAPGVYTALAWESVLPGAYQNSDFLEKYQSRGKAVNVQAGTRSEVQLDLIQGN